MKPSIINVAVGFLIFMGMFYVYNLLFEDDMGWNEILLMSFFISLGNELIVPRLIKWSQAKGWVSKR
ncbi:hypothetical protein N9B83_03265 [Schleiferiaceae bacterium]|jgi:hypothetical protein|nr:hypothetical protein [Schleiferiaceae bacterium]MDC1537955.1 hypothetical protein [Schleiferiaceae bacterium]